MLENLCNFHLLSQKCKIHQRPFSRSWRHRRLDRRGRRFYAESGRGDHFPCGQVPRVAHGRLVLVLGWDDFSGRLWGRRRLGDLGIRPRVVFTVEGAIRLPDGEDEMEQLAHAVAHGHVAALPRT